jgi:hypothetical protein
MSHAYILTEYWDEIFFSIVYLINRLPNHSSQIPFTTLFFKEPDYNFLRVLGCLCFPYTRPYNAKKLQLRSLPCVFLGYASNKKGYRCLHILTNRIFVSRHVQFVKNIFSFQLQTKNKTNTTYNLEPTTLSYLSLIIPSSAQPKLPRQ